MSAEVQISETSERLVVRVTHLGRTVRLGPAATAAVLQAIPAIAKPAIEDTLSNIAVRLGRVEALIAGGIKAMERQTDATKARTR